MDRIEYSDFEKVEMRVGTILEASAFPKARNPSYKLLIDVGEQGKKQSSAQITDLYSAQDLIGKQVIVVCNFAPKQIADFMSECLILGIIADERGVILLSAERPVQNGMRIA